MFIKRIKGPIDDNALNNINHNFGLSDVLRTQINDLVLGSGGSNAEVAQARGGHQVLSDRLNETDKQLAENTAEVIQARGNELLLKDRLNKTDQQLAQTQREKISRGEVTVHDINKNQGLFDETYMTEEFREQMAGNTPINVTPVNKSVTRVKLADKAIDPRKTTMFNSTNLFNKNTIQIGKSMNVQGEIVDETGRWLSDLIEVSPGQTLYITSGSYRAMSYDENLGRVWSRQSSSDGTVTANEDDATTYIRISGTTGQNIDEIMLNTGTGLLPFEPYGTLKDEYVPDVITDRAIEPKHTTFFNVSRNLFNKNDVETGKTMDTSGNIVEDEVRWLSDLIEANYGEKFYISEGSYRFMSFDENLNPTGNRQSLSDGVYTAAINPSTKYIRVSGITGQNMNEIMLNRGDGLLPHEAYGDTVVLDNLPVLPTSKLDMEAIKNEIGNNTGNEIGSRHPFPARITPDIRSSEYRMPLWLAEDGDTIYGYSGSTLRKSVDDWETTEVIHAFDGSGLISAIRDLRNGEIIVCQDRHDGTETKARVWVSENYSNPEIETTWEQVVEASTQSARFTNYWGISVYDNIVFLSEYGNRGEAGKAYLSIDYGKTFKVAYDLYADPLTPDISQAHIHSSAYDPYWNRFWLTTGDATNSATLYSDDFCETWKFIDNLHMRQGTDKDAYQFVTIIPMPNCILFASDRSRMSQGYAPNGVYRLARTEQNRINATYEDIELAYQFDDSSDLTYMGRLGFQRYGKDEPMYISFGKPGGSPRFTPGIILATFDGYKFHNIYTDTDGEGFGVFTIVGPTNSNKLIGTINDTRQSATSVFKADSPEWVSNK